MIYEKKPKGENLMSDSFKIYFFKTLIALKVKCFWTEFKFYLIHYKLLGKYAKILIFHQNNILQYYFL